MGKMNQLRDVYAQKAISQVPRLLSLQDRNPYSPTYGCFDRGYWLDKTSDFPDAVRQFGVHALALIYRHDFLGSIYKGQPKICEWAIAGLDFWARIQHRDGSFDEFYPYERGWVGPSAFTTFAAVEALRLLGDEVPRDVTERVQMAIRRAARFIAAGESEEDHLANHHAMACLAVWKAYKLLDDPQLKAGFEGLWEGFLGYCDAEEGWLREYDGVDPGYLSASVSFLAKIYQDNSSPAILEVARRAVEFCSYFTYPNGFYAGSLGSRNTLHFYPHGFEVLAAEVPLAAAVAEKMLRGLARGALVPPEIMSDRYVFYRVPEFLQAYLDYTPRPTGLPPLPYEREPFTRYFPRARIYVANRPRYYVVANLAKGGVLKVFDRQEGRLLLNDCGLIGRLADRRVVTSQWVDPEYVYQADEDGWEVSGHLNVVPSNKVFTPFKSLLFRLILVAFGWLPAFSHLLKGSIRRMLILGRRTVPVRFRRRFRMSDQAVSITDQLQLERDVQVVALSVGGEFYVRYVPQSRYFQSQELDIGSTPLTQERLNTLSQQRQLTLRRQLDANKYQATLDNTPADESLPSGVYGIEYYYGRKHSRQLIYRLRRRTSEVETALRKHGQGALRRVVDVGTADGLMLEDLRQRFPEVTFYGLDLSYALLCAYPTGAYAKLQGDALYLPFVNGQADAVIATAVIEHVPDASRMLEECARILRSDGLLILTTPDPLMEHVSSAIGLLKDARHYQMFRLKELQYLVERAAFRVVEARKFMFSPVGFPAEKAIERVFGSLGLSLIMANQLVVARRC